VSLAGGERLSVDVTFVKAWPGPYGKQDDLPPGQYLGKTMADLSPAAI
jgi:hypothetical protein